MIGCVIGGFAVRYHILIHDARDKVKTLPCDEHGKKLDQIPVIHEKVETLSTKVETIIEFLSDIYGALVTKKMIDPAVALKKFSALSVTLSPRRMSELGLELYQKSGMQLLFENNKNRFIEKIEKQKPAAALDVEELALSILYNSTHEPVFKPVKDWLFNNPVFNGLDIDMSAICLVASFELRDIYLEKHPELLPDLEPVHT